MKWNINNLFIKLIKRFHPIIFIIILSLVPFYWFSGSSYPAAGSDTGLIFFGHNSLYLFKSYMYVWADLSEAMGSYHAYHVLFLPWIVFMRFLFLLNINGHYREIIIYSLILFFSMYFFYNFTLELFLNIPKNKIIAFIASLFFIFNVQILFFFGGFSFAIYALPFMAASFYFTLKGVRTLNLKYIFYINLLISFVSIIFALIQVVLPIILCLVLFILFYAVVNSKQLNFKNYFKYFFILLLSIVLINSWWIPTFAYSLFREYSIFAKNFNLINYLRDSSHQGNILTYFINPYNSYLLHSLNFSSEWKFLLIYYSNPIIKILNFFFFTIVILSFFVINREAKKNKLILFFYFLFIIILFLILGYNKPFAFIFVEMFKNVPFFSGFVSVYQDFIILLLLSYSILFAIGILYFYEFYVKYISKNKFVLFVILVISYFLCLYPFFIGKAVRIPNQFYSKNKNKYEIANVFVKIPTYYKKISCYFHKDNLRFNILTLPLSWDNNTNFNWNNYYHSADTIWLLYKHRSISSYHYNRYPYVEIIYQLQKNKFYKALELLGLLSIKYVIIQNDEIINSTSSEFNRIYISKKEYPTLLKKAGLKFVKQFGRANIYMVPDKYYINTIYVPDNIIIVNNDNGSSNYFKTSIGRNSTSIVADIAIMPHFNIRSAIFFAMHYKKVKKFGINNNKLRKIIMLVNGKVLTIESNRIQLPTPIIEFKEINPTKYIIIVHNAKKNFPLILNQSYSHYWNLYVEKYPSSLTKHIGIVNAQCPGYLYGDCMGIKRLRYNIQEGNISYIGNRFISKNFNGTIQNDNIPSGRIFQTLFKNPYSDRHHFIANGYANSWLININDIKEMGRHYYKKNKNGTYDFEFIIDFWPQRLFYIGIIISGSTIIIFVLYLIYNAVKKRKTK